MSKDPLIISAAFTALQQLQDHYGDAIPYFAIADGFWFEGERVNFETKARGIFKPKIMTEGVLSIKTTISREGRYNIYNDQRSTEGFYHYSLQKGDVKGGGNKLLWQSQASQMPFVYFHGVSPGIYKAIWPCFVKQINVVEGYAAIVVGARESVEISERKNYELPTEFESRYQVRETKVRLHQESFRLAILTAYNKTCAITGISEPQLIEAAHIIPDSQVDQQTVSNGIALSAIHHKAYDAKLIGIDADFRIHISDRIGDMKDNRFAREAFLKLSGKRLIKPKVENCRPDRDHLARTFEGYVQANS